MIEKDNQTPLPSIRNELPPLPIEYVRVFDEKGADYIERLIPRVVFTDIPPRTRTPAQALEDIRKMNEEKQWYTEKYWREKGVPHEQINFRVNDKPIVVYNYHGSLKFSDEHIQKTHKAFEVFFSKFPQAIDRMKWLLIEDAQPDSLLGDEQQYPTNGHAYREQQMFKLYPRGMEFFPHRIQKASNLEGTIVHELTHLIDAEFREEWEKKYQWGRCWQDRYKDAWESRKTNSGHKKWFHKVTGWMAPQGEFPLQPDECITEYAKQNVFEDICEGVVAYVFDPDGLMRVSECKYDMISHHDRKTTAHVQYERVPATDISLPAVEPQTVRYYLIDN